MTEQQLPKPKVLWVVGGFVRDALANKHTTLPHQQSKDVDFALEVDSYDEMVAYLQEYYPGVEIAREDKVYGRLIAGIPTHHLFWTAQAYLEMFGNLPKVIYADVVMSRSEGDYSDGRHPDHVTPASIELDLARRDFTANAIAINDGTGAIYDPYDGIKAIQRGVLLTVGNPHDRFTEDALRILRYWRFHITKGYQLSAMVDFDIRLYAYDYAQLLTKPVFHDRIREEFEKMLRADTPATLKLLYENVPTYIKDVVFGENKLWLQPTYAQK